VRGLRPRDAGTLMYRAWLAGVCGCIPSLSAPSAYDDQVWVCDDPAAYDALVADCDQDAGCAGIASLEGTIEGSPFVVTAALFHTILRATDDTGTLTRLDAFGTGPYFDFALIAKSLGGGLEGAVSRDLAYSYDAEDLPDALGDDRVQVDLRVGIPLRTTDLAAHPDSGTWTVHSQTEDRITLSFDGRFGAEDDEVRGCATLRPLEVRRE
jgi:hypothetical protein